MIRKNICKMIVDWLLLNEPEKTYVKIDADRQKIIPFFNERIVRNENDDILFTDDKPERMLFLGEDYSFCWLARRAGCTIKAWFSSTLGHEVSHIICDTKHNCTDETQKSLFCPEQIILKGYSTEIRKDIILNKVETDKKFNITYLCGFGRVKFSPLTNIGRLVVIMLKCMEMWNQIIMMELCIKLWNNLIIRKHMII